MRSQWFALAAVPALLVVGPRCTMAAEPEAKPKITISRETTYITEPLRPDGYPDYVAALNERMSPMVQAMGPAELPQEPLTERVYRALQMQPLPAEGKYLVTDDEIIKHWKAKHPEQTPALDDENSIDDAINEQFGRAASQPWSADELPLAAQWLDANQRPLELAVEASRRTRFYWPVVTGKDPGSGLIAALLPVTQASRSMAQLVVARGLQRAKQGDIDGAWQDLLACHRLARLVGQGWTLIDVLVCYAIEGVAIQGDAALAHYARPTAGQIEKMRADLRALPPLPDLLEVIDKGERLCFLDSVVIAARDGLPSLHALTGYTAQPDKQREAWSAMLLGEGMVDWNVPLRMGNQWYDRLIKIGGISDRTRRKAEFEAFYKDVDKMVAQLRDPKSLIVRLLTSRKASEFTSPQIGSVLIALFMPALDAVFITQDRTRLNIEMGDTALALAAYRADHGRYPEKLDQLVPKYFPKVSADTFSPDGAPLRYRREGDAYVLWSVHQDGVDDNGRSYQDDPSADDWRLRPVREPK